MMEALETKQGNDQIKNWKVIFYCLVTVLVAVTFLSHIYLPHPHGDVSNIQNKRNDVINRIGLLKDSLINYSVKVDFNQANGLNIYNEIKKLENQEDELNQKYKAQKAKVAIFGFPSPHKFLWHFGVGLVILVLALDMLRTLIYFNGKHRKARAFGAFTALMISGYYMAWIFYPENDLPKNVYLHILLVIGILSGITGVYIASVKRKRIVWLKYKILNVLTELKNSHIKSIFKIAIKSDPYNETYQSELKESSQRLTKKMHDDANEILHY